MAVAGCKDRRLLDNTGSSTTGQPKAAATTVKSVVTAAPAQTQPPVATTSGVVLAAYTVVSGDTLFDIARKHKMSLGALMDMNSLTDANRIQVGQKLKVQLVTVATTATAPVATNAPAPASTVPPGVQTSIVTITVIVTVPPATANK